MRRLSRKTATPAEISRCVREDPAMALMCAADQLTDDQVTACAARVPASAILYVWYRLSLEIQKKCIRRAPAMALKILPDQLTPEQFRDCSKRAPRAARETLSRYYAARLEI
jgi:hypothetical protein